MVKTFLYRIRIPLLEWYFAAATCYFCMLGLNLSFITTGVIMGFVNTYLVAPIVFALQDEVVKDQRDFLKEPTYILANVVKATVILCLMMGIYYLIHMYVFPTSVEPFTFGMLYWVLDKGFHKIGMALKSWRKKGKAEKTQESEN